mmetsp:Transcript_12677/g.9208  ORF Transcript_12677/g.9208 Transcript_12677/m.9208 type:complete len:103 (-) Transcript_12677:190-498(-)
MNALFFHIVDVVGTSGSVQQTESLWNFFDYFSQQLAYFEGAERYLDHELHVVQAQELGKFVGNHLGHPKAFEKITQALFRLEEATELHEEVLKVIRMHYAIN